jgi:RNase P/RNase MRP subunit POP5
MSPAETDEPRPTRRPRYRYILVETTKAPGPSREDLVRLLQSRAPPGIGIWLTRYDGEWGIVRVARDGLPAARSFLDSGSVPVRAALTSGSIAGLQRKHPGARGLRQSRR